MIFHWPQITMIVLVAISVGYDLSMHGKPKVGNHNFIASVVSSSITLWLLYKGGFFG